MWKQAMIGVVLLGAALGPGCSQGASGGGSPGGGSAAGGDDAVAVAQAWLEVVDRGDYQESWDQAASYFQGAVPAGQWQQQLTAVRGPLGSVQSREVISTQPATELPGAPDGEYVVIQFRTSFANKANAVETVTPMRDTDGSFHVSGYYIR